MTGTSNLRAWNDDRPFSYQNPNTRLNDFQTNFNNRLDLTLRPNLEFPSFNLRTPLSPNLTINTWTMRLPEIHVPDIGNSLWTYQRVENHFNAEIKAYDHYAANINFKFGEAMAERGVGMDLGNMKFPVGQFAPESFRRTYRDEFGNTLTRERTNQISRTNDSYNSFVQFYQRQDHVASGNRLLNSDPGSLRRPVEPSIELIDSFSEKWQMSIADEGAVRQKSLVNLNIDSIKYETNLHRFVSEYSGTVKDGRQNLSFKVTSPHESNGLIQFLTVEMSGKGAPTAKVSWKPVDGQNSDDALKLLRDNLPVPLLVGPRSNFRLNGVDMVESPLHVTPKGDLSSKQLGKAQDLVNLVGKENLGIEVSFSPPASDSPKTGFSLGNSVRNLWYMVTGRWSEVKGMRQQLSNMQTQEPGKFVLVAGFSDPGFMGIKDLRTALDASKRIYLPQSKNQPLVSDLSKTTSQVDQPKSGMPASRPGIFTKALEVLTTPVGVLFKTAVGTVKTALSVVFGGRIKEEPLKGYDPMVDPEDLKSISNNSSKKMEFFTKQKPDRSSDAPSAVFEIRHTYDTPPLLNILPHAPFISMAKGEKPSEIGVYFNRAPTEFIEELKTAKSIDLFFHGYNVRSNSSLDLRSKFTELLDAFGHKNINALISWSGDMGNNFFSRMLFFNRSVKSTNLSWEGVASTADFIRSFNPDIKINATTHSLGAGMLLEAASQGVKFGTVILIVPAVDNEALCAGGKYEKALQNIDKLVVVYSRNQGAVFIPYMLGRFDRALGDVGPSGPVNHRDFIAINATKRTTNQEFGIHVKNHGDIYGEKMLEMMIKSVRGH